MLDNSVKSGSTIPFYDTEEPEPEPKKGTTTLMKLTEGLTLNEAGIKASEKLIQMSSEQQQVDKKL
jgi:hypothetical protein